MRELAKSVASRCSAAVYKAEAVRGVRISALGKFRPGLRVLRRRLHFRNYIRKRLAANLKVYPVHHNIIV